MKIDELVVGEKYSFWFGFPFILILDVRYTFHKIQKMGFYLATNTLPVEVIANAFPLLLLGRYLFPFTSLNRYVSMICSKGNFFLPLFLGMYLLSETEYPW